jgi:putative PEP-CTERM system histidine kinase
MHDLKNLIAQLSLVVRNAEKHHNNPEFMRDAIRTVEHAVDKMSRLMAQIKNFATGDTTAELDLTSLLREVINSRSFQLPVPVLQECENKIFTQADPDRLGSALEHIIHNAQDAAGKHGTVTISYKLAETGHAVIKVIDNGHGMEQEFIRTRLFKPFDTTKGLTGMGIGAYESREYIRSIGGELFVKSEIDKGTQFTFLIPVAGHQPNLISAEVTLP